MSVPKSEIVVHNFTGKNDQPRKIYYLSWTEFYELFDGKPC